MIVVCRNGVIMCTEIYTTETTILEIDNRIGLVYQDGSIMVCRAVFLVIIIVSKT